MPRRNALLTSVLATLPATLPATLLAAAMTIVLTTALPGANAHAADGMVTEVVDVGYRPVEEMVELLRPLVPRPGSVSGAYGKLVIRTTPQNMREIKSILAELNRAPANLLISVRYQLDDEVRRDLYQVYGEARGDDSSISVGREPRSGRGLGISAEGDDVSAAARVDRSERDASGGGTQRVRVLEGREAFIRSGQAVPVDEQRVVTSSSGVTTIQRSTGYRNVDSGFYVRARLAGDDRVNVEIFPQNNRLDPASGRIDVREASTVVSSPLGRWMEIGGVSGASSASTRGIGSGSSTSTRNEYATYLKDERLDR